MLWQTELLLEGISFFFGFSITSAATVLLVLGGEMGKRKFLGVRRAVNAEYSNHGTKFGLNNDCYLASILVRRLCLLLF